MPGFCADWHSGGRDVSDFRRRLRADKRFWRRWVLPLVRFRLKALRSRRRSAAGRRDLQRRTRAVHRQDRRVVGIAQQVHPGAGHAELRQQRFVDQRAQRRQACGASVVEDVQGQLDRMHGLPMAAAAGQSMLGALERFDLRLGRDAAVHQALPGPGFGGVDAVLARGDDDHRGPGHQDRAHHDREHAPHQDLQDGQAPSWPMPLAAR